MSRHSASGGSSGDRAAGGDWRWGDRANQDGDRRSVSGDAVVARLSMEEILALTPRQFERYIKSSDFKRVKTFPAFLRFLSKTPANMRSFGRSKGSLVPYLMGFGTYPDPPRALWCRFNTLSLQMLLPMTQELKDKTGEIDEDFFLSIFRRNNAHWQEHIEVAVELFKEVIQEGWLDGNTELTRKYRALNNLTVGDLRVIQSRKRKRSVAQSVVSAVMQARVELPPGDEDNFDDIDWGDFREVDAGGMGHFGSGAAPLGDGAAGGASSLTSTRMRDLSQLLPSYPSFATRDRENENERNVCRHVGHCTPYTFELANVHTIFPNAYVHDESDDFYTNVDVGGRSIGINLTAIVDIIGPLCDPRLSDSTSIFRDRFGGIDTQFGLITAIYRDQALWNEFVTWFSRGCPYQVEVQTAVNLEGLPAFDDGGMEIVDELGLGTGGFGDGGAATAAFGFPAASAASTHPTVASAAAAAAGTGGSTPLPPPPPPPQLALEPLLPPLQLTQLLLLPLLEPLLLELLT